VKYVYYVVIKENSRSLSHILMSFLSLQLSVAKEMGVTMDCVIGNVLAVAVAVVLAVVVNAFSFGFTNTLREKNSAQGR